VVPRPFGRHEAGRDRGLGREDRLDARGPIATAPDDWPAAVTLAGSPPKAPISSRTQRNASNWSRNAMFVAARSGA
jgi:hypothetical protein